MVGGHTHHSRRLRFRVKRASGRARPEKDGSPLAMNLKDYGNLPEVLLGRLGRPLASRVGRSRFAPGLNYGREFGPPARDARPAAVLLLLYPREGQWHIPLILRPRGMSNHAGQIGLPGGLIEPGESTQQAAIRETEEELGIRLKETDLLGRLSPSYVHATNYCVTPHVAAIDRLPTMRPNPEEVARVLNVPLAALLDPARRGSHEVNRRGAIVTAPHITWEGHRIWGATYIILGELIDVLEEIVGA